MRKLPFTLSPSVTLSANATQATRRAQARKGYVTAKAPSPLIDLIKRALRLIW